MRVGTAVASYHKNVSLRFTCFISQSLSMFWRCSRAATIAVGI